MARTRLCQTKRKILRPKHELIHTHTRTSPSSCHGDVSLDTHLKPQNHKLARTKTIKTLKNQ